MLKKKRAQRGTPAEPDLCGDHARRNAKLPLVEELGFDDTEKSILEIVRHLSCGLAVPAYDGLARALECANAEWGEQASSRIVESLANLLGRLQAARTGAFDFIVADCPTCSKHICESELQLMLLLRAGRRKDGRNLREIAQLVAISGNPNSLVMAANVFARIINAQDADSQPEMPTLH